MAYDDGFYYGQCKLICTAVDSSMDGKSITATATDGSSAAAMGTIQGGKCTLTVPGRALYKVEVDGYSKDVECGYGDCIVVYLADGYDNINQKDLLGLEDIESDASLDYKAASAQAVKDVLDDKLGGCIISEVNGEFFIEKVGADSAPKKLGKLAPDLINHTATYNGSQGVLSTLVYDAEEFTKVKWKGDGAKGKSISSLMCTNNRDLTNYTYVASAGNALDDTWYDISEYKYVRLDMRGIGGASTSLPKLLSIEWSSSTATE